jgi:hypothetical protein
VITYGKFQPSDLSEALARELRLRLAPKYPVFVVVVPRSSSSSFDVLRPVIIIVSVVSKKEKKKLTYGVIVSCQWLSLASGPFFRSRSLLFDVVVGPLVVVVVVVSVVDDEQGPETLLRPCQ